MSPVQRPKGPLPELVSFSKTSTATVESARFPLKDLATSHTSERCYTGPSDARCKRKTERLASYLVVGKHNCDQAAVVDNYEHLRRFPHICNS